MRKPVIHFVVALTCSIGVVLAMPGVAQAASWHSWSFLGIPEDVHTAEEGIGLAARSTGELDVFMADGSGRVWHKWWLANGGWRPWGQLAYPGDVGACGQVAAAWKPPSQLHVVVMECDMQLQHTYWTGGAGWAPWRPLPDPPPGVCWHPGMGARFDGNLDVVVIGCDRNIWQRTLSPIGTWSQWVNLQRPTGGAGLTLSADITGRISGEVDIFVTDNNGAVWHRWWLPSGGWRPWGSIGEPAAENCSAPGSVGRGTGQLHVGVAGCDRRVYVRTWARASGWGDWVLTGANPANVLPNKDAPPGMAGRASGELDIVARFGGGFPYHNWYG